MIDEHILLAKAQTGDREALNALMTEYWQPVYRLIYSRLANPEDAKELTQDTFMKAFRALPGYKSMGVSFKSYLGKIALNLVTDFWRKNGRAPQVVGLEEYQETLWDSGEKPEEYILRREGQERVNGLLKYLPEEQRQAIRLRVLLGISVHDTAVLMNKTEAAIKMLQQRALKNLRSLCLETGMVK